MTAPATPPDPVADLAAALTRVLAADPWAKYPAVLTAHHVAELLDIDPDSVGEACRRGKLPMRKKNGRYVVAQDVFRAWLASEES